MRLFSVGALFALAGIYWEVTWLIWFAIAFLLIGLVIRFLPIECGSSVSDEEGNRDGAEDSSPR
ncbi:hypothetical protein ACFL3S_01930 [Gemmatimonadota bacterium]